MTQTDKRTQIERGWGEIALFIAIWMAAMIVAYTVWGDLGGGTVLLATVVWIFGRLTGEQKARETRQ
jgi:hypothetical protein